VILNSDRRKYLDILGQCDKNTGKEPFNGANATIDQIQPFVEYLSYYLERKLEFAKELLDGISHDISETDVKAEDPRELGARVGVKLSVNQIEIIKLIQANRNITVTELSQNIHIARTSVHNNLKKLTNLGIIERIGSDKSGYWRVR